ncbi:hypothetical protein FNV65_43790 [Streptomyces sp. S1A1-8]|uniref:hypothetical protein n=1 Tax=unclassified Streptomyces TaxID=2593676 RepID=UPI001163456C|nr:MULTISPECIES: hypothetical protein [unclassified Streptomyces]QDO02196.1 hypothetical protein FNV58_45205 [Streptomyces sp. RLB1-9]QDO23931.1 hypothetical protein FNV65_43790 [Streptomyces sp. S1A1-8]QDO34055.1 hypothetical protein FNV63_43815 [Streptomyces sp. S1A1-3]
MSGSDDKTKVPIKVWVGGTLGAALFITALIWGPWWIEGHHLKDDKGELVSSAGIIVTGFRTMLVAIGAGIFTAFGLWYTRKKHELDQRQFEHAQQQFATTLRETQQRDEQQAELTREGQVTGRYVEVIKLLRLLLFHSPRISMDAFELCRICVPFRHQSLKHLHALAGFQ